MATAKLRPFLDTNVLIAGLYNPDRLPATILKRHEEGRLTIVISSQVLDELTRVLRLSKPDLLGTFDTFRRRAPLKLAPEPDAATVRRFRAFINAADAGILAAAVASNADCLVTGNTRHFTRNVERRAGIPIFTPSAYVASFMSA